MSTTLAIVLPVFGLIAVGWVAGRTNLIGEAGVAGLTAFVLWVAVPGLLFRTIQRAAPLEALDLDVALAYYLAAALVAAGAFAAGRAAFRLSAGEAALFAMAGMFANTTLIGVPLVYAAFGDEGMVPLLIVITFHSVVFVTAVMVVLDLDRRGGVRWAGIGRSILASLATNPVVIAIAVGLAWSAGGLPVPGVVDTMIGFLGDGAIPAALVAVGAALARFRIAGNLPQAGTAAAVKLLVHPAVAFAVAKWAFALDDLAVAVLTITAALPAGMMVFVLARTYGIYLARAGTSVVLSTGASVATLAAVLAWFHG